jgi:hypothetical protein
MSNTFHRGGVEELIKGGVDIRLLLKKLDSNIPVTVREGSVEHQALTFASDLYTTRLIDLFNVMQAQRRRRPQGDPATLKPQSVRANKSNERKRRRRQSLIVRYLLSQGVDVEHRLKLTPQEVEELKTMEV